MSELIEKWLRRDVKHQIDNLLYELTKIWVLRGTEDQIDNLLL